MLTNSYDFPKAAMQHVFFPHHFVKLHVIFCLEKKNLYFYGKVIITSSIMVCYSYTYLAGPVRWNTIIVDTYGGICCQAQQQQPSCVARWQLLGGGTMGAAQQ